MKFIHLVSRITKHIHKLLDKTPKSMAHIIPHVAMYIPVTGTVVAKHSSHISLFKEIRDFFHKPDVNLTMFSEK
jgi:hypothetical protein